MLSALAPSLSCPVCTAELAAQPSGGPVRALRCEAGHSFDVARQGHVSLLRGGHTHAGDTADMVAHRLAFLGAGHYDDIVAALVTALTSAPEGPLLDIGGGPGWYAAQVLSAREHRLIARGQSDERAAITFDTSTAAARRAAKAHPRLVSLVADGWSSYPIRDHAIAAAMSVFAPRNPVEIARVLSPGGLLVTVTPTADHLREARGPLGLLDVGADKEARLAESLTGATLLTREVVRRRMSLSHDDLEHLALMGPSAFHLDADALRERIGGLPPISKVTCEVIVGSYRFGG